MTTLTNTLNVCENCGILVDEFSCYKCGEYKSIMTLSEYEKLYGEFTGY